jgi:hypothetical protein
VACGRKTAWRTSAPPPWTGISTEPYGCSMTILSVTQDKRTGAFYRAGSPNPAERLRSNSSPAVTLKRKPPRPNSASLSPSATGTTGGEPLAPKPRARRLRQFHRSQRVVVVNTSRRSAGNSSLSSLLQFSGPPSPCQRAPCQRAPCQRAPCQRAPWQRGFTIATGCITLSAM